MLAVPAKTRFSLRPEAVDLDQAGEGLIGQLRSQLCSEKESKYPLSIGLLAVVDDVAAIAKLAAASLDDVASQAAKAGAKAAAIVVDDAAVTPRYVVGFAAERELPIVGRIALGSLRNKLLILLPCTLALSYFLPSMITPLLMFGGAYLCYEGTEKVLEAIVPHRAHAHEARLETVALNPHSLEDEKVAGAIKTDFILSAEIMTIALAAVPEAGIVMQAFVLALVGIGITVAVYGAVALIVKADDLGMALAKYDGRSMTGGLRRVIGRALVRGMPYFLTLLGAVGTAAMIWVGGGIIVHGFAAYGAHSVGHAIHSAAELTAGALMFAPGAVRWTVEIFLLGLVGLLIGAVCIPLVELVFAPAWRLLKVFHASAKGGDRPSSASR
jgi:predicted DNA repair protein MutK